MIKPYRNIPRFDEGFDWSYANQLINNSSPSMYPNMNMSFTGAGEDPYVRVEPEIDIESPDFMRAVADDILKKPAPKRVTTAVQDRRAALKAYTNAVRAADKKAAAENKTAKAEIKKNEAVLRRNGIKAETGKYGTVYNAYANMQAGAVGRVKSKTNDVKKEDKTYKPKPFLTARPYISNPIINRLNKAGHSIYEENRKKRKQLQNITQKQKDAARAKARAEAIRYAKSRRGPNGQAPGGLWNPLNWFK